MSGSTVGIYAKSTNIKNLHVKIAHDACDSLDSPTAMLLGRIIKVSSPSGDDSHFSVANDKKADGIILTGRNEITLADGYKVEVGTGVSPVGWLSERRVIITGPLRIAHGDVLSDYVEANGVPIKMMNYFLEEVEEDKEVA